MEKSLSTKLNTPIFNAQRHPTRYNDFSIFRTRRKEVSRKFFRIMSEIDLTCPNCGGKVQQHGSYIRKLKIEGEQEKLTILRVKCTQCKKTHAVLPDFIRPHKHYDAEAMEMAIEDDEAGMKPEEMEQDASESTIRRWLRQYHEQKADYLGALQGLIYRIKEQVSSVAGKGKLKLKEFERMIDELPQIVSSRSVISKMNQWLVNGNSRLWI